MKINLGSVDFDTDELGREGSLGLLIAKMNLETRADNDYAKRFVELVARVCDATNQDTQRLDKLRRACGFIENGTSGSVTLSQDDATKDWVVSEGRNRGYGTGLREAIDKLEIRDDD